MAVIKPFFCIRPDEKHVTNVAALPYDVYNREEAREIVKRNPLSFLSIDRGETNFDKDVDIYSDEVYEMSASLLKKRIVDGIFVEEETECLYLYELTMNGHIQTGIVGCASVGDYINGVIKKHENTRVEKEIDRTKHIKACQAHTGPIFLLYRRNDILKDMIQEQKKQTPLYDFVSEDGVKHVIYRISDDEVIREIQREFEKIPQIYIADGHHRGAAAVNVAKDLPKNCGDIHDDISSHTECNHFPSVFFDEDEVHIMDYNRVVKDLNGLSEEDFLHEIKKYFDIAVIGGKMSPSEKGMFSMLLGKQWYLCKIRDEFIPEDMVESLDVSLLQKYILNSILGIENPREDKRIDFVGGIRGLEELERRCATDCKVAFAMYPTSIQELFDVADAGKLMPPKSTWFEPKLRSGVFVHRW